MGPDTSTPTSTSVSYEKREGRLAAVRLPIRDSRQPLREPERGPIGEAAHPEVVSSEPPSFTMVSATGSSAPTPRVNLDWMSKNGDQEALSVTKRLNTRGTRGRGDPRNESMRKAREKVMEQQRLREARQLRDDRPISSPTREPTLVLRGPRQSDLVMSSLGDSPDTSPDHPCNPAFVQHYPHTSPAQRRTQANGKVIVIHGPPSSTGRRNNIFQRPSPQLPRATMQQTPSGPVMRRPDDWTHWVEISVKLFGLPTNVTTRDIWRCLSTEGCIMTIELYEDNRGTREGKGRVRFS